MIIFLSSPCANHLSETFVLEDSFVFCILTDNVSLLLIHSNRYGPFLQAVYKSSAFPPQISCHLQAVPLRSVDVGISTTICLPNFILSLPFPSFCFPLPLCQQASHPSASLRQEGLHRLCTVSTLTPSPSHQLQGNTQGWISWVCKEKPGRSAVKSWSHGLACGYGLGSPDVQSPSA